MKNRCVWAQKEIFYDYHDNEWGVPVYDDRLLFEMLILEGAQAGLSWETILKRREGYRKAYKNFDLVVVSKFDDNYKQELLRNTGIIRNKLKVAASVINAKLFIEIQKEFGSFDKYLWGFTDGKVINNQIKFVGPTIIYAYLQAVGVVNDHEVGCFCKV